MVEDPGFFAYMELAIPDICHFFTLAKFLKNKIYTKKTRKLRQNTQFIAIFLRYYGKIHSKLPIFRVKSEKNLHLPEKFTLTASAASATIIWYAQLVQQGAQDDKLKG